MSMSDELLLNMEVAITDVGAWNKKVTVIPAEDGEELTHEIKEITDDEAVDILEGVNMTDDCSLTAKENSVKISELTEKVINIESRIFDHQGDKGHISKTDEQFVSLSEDIKEGFKTVHGVIKSLDETIQYALKEQNKKIESQDNRLDDHETRISLLESYVKRKAVFGERWFQWVLAVGSGVILLLAGIFLGGK